MRVAGGLLAFTIAAILTACTGQQAEEAESWVDCRFRDASYGRVTPADCEAADGWARPPSASGGVVPYRMTIEWEGRAAPMQGVLMAPKQGLAGTVSIDLGDTLGDCEGTFRYTRTPHGVWSADCDGGLTASGTFVHHGGQHVVAGFGDDSDGNAISFDAWPPPR